MQHTADIETYVILFISVTPTNLVKFRKSICIIPHQREKTHIFQYSVKHSKFISPPMLGNICYFLKRGSESVAGLHLRVRYNKTYVSLMRRNTIVSRCT